MPTSVMPKGVEHARTGMDVVDCEMPTSVMPKGVEHSADRSSRQATSQMPTSVMPKGVEHSTVAVSFLDIADAHLCDAERR